MAEFTAPNPLTVPNHLILEVATILDAVDSDHTVKFSYRDAEGVTTVREVVPKGLTPKAGTLLLHTDDLGRGEHRDFRVDRIQHFFAGRPVLQENYKERTIRLAREFVQSKGVDVSEAEAGVQYNWNGDTIVRVGFRIPNTDNAFTVLAFSYDNPHNPTKITLADVEVYSNFF